MLHIFQQGAQWCFLFHNQNFQIFVSVRRVCSSTRALAASSELRKAAAAALASQQRVYVQRWQDCGRQIYDNDIDHDVSFCTMFMKRTVAPILVLYWRQYLQHQYQGRVVIFDNENGVTVRKAILLQTTLSLLRLKSRRCYGVSVVAVMKSFWSLKQREIWKGWTERRWRRSETWSIARPKLLLEHPDGLKKARWMVWRIQKTV